MALYLLSIYFTIGAIGTWIYTRKKESPAKKEIWTKYFVFLFLTLTLVSLLVLQWLTYLTVIVFIILMGLSEILRLRRRIPITLLIFSSILYILVGYGFWNFQVNYSQNDILNIFILVITLDGFSQLSGQLFGQTKFLPAVSPNKTLEGYAGGIAITILSSLLLFNGTSKLLLTIVIIAGAICGDLSASWLKRKAGIKDFSNIIPGHGGILDRYDSFIMAGAFALMFLEILNLKF